MNSTRGGLGNYKLAHIFCNVLYLIVMFRNNEEKQTVARISFKDNNDVSLLHSHYSLHKN